jgi:Domain of unknown function (DUF4440)
MTETHSPEAIYHSYRELHRAIRAKDRHELEQIHDPEFQGAELPGRLISAEEHITTAINGVDLEIVTYGITAEIFDDIALSWGAQTLAGELDPEDPGTSPAMAAEVRDGLWFSYLLLWRFIDGRWRVLTYQCTRLHLPELQGGEPFVSELPLDYAHEGHEGGAGVTRARSSEEERAEAEAQIAAAFERLFAAIQAKDRAGLEALHDPEFRGSDLEGRLVEIEDHVAGALAAGELEMELFDLEVRRYGDFALSWGKQTLAEAGAEGEPTLFSFLIVWRLGAEGWRMIRYQLTELEETAAGAAA